MLNKVTLIGNLGKDPEYNAEVGSGVTKFSLATSERWKNKDGEQQDKTTWHNIVVWGKQAEIIAQYFSKGSRIYIEGKIDNRSYEKDGETKYISEVIVSEFKFIDKKSDGDADCGSPTAEGDKNWFDEKAQKMPQKVALQAVTSDDDLPF